MTPLHFPSTPQKRESVDNVNELVAQQTSLGETAADKVADVVGSWRFILIQFSLLTVWVLFNITGWVMAWDPYPFILMNLALSAQAAFTAPIIMMSQNRQAKKDRIEAHNDYRINQRTSLEMGVLLEHINSQNEALSALYAKLEHMEHLLENNKRQGGSE
jgi:uncharacterized membrane protein